MNRRMRMALTLAIGLLSLGELLLVQWGLLAFRGEGLALVESALGLLALASLNFRLYPAARRRIHASGLSLAFSRVWIMSSVAVLLTGLLLTGVFIVVGGAGWALGVSGGDNLPLIWLGGLVVFGGFGSILWGTTVGNIRVRVDPIHLPLPGLHPDVAKLRIAHITDLHIGPLLRAERLRGFVETINRLDPDLVVITGDIFDFDPKYIDEGCRELGKLCARHGVFAVLGNHDVYTGAELVAEGLRKLSGIRLLRDEWVRIEVGESVFVLAGLEDSGEGWTERHAESAELEQLASDRPPDLPCVLLAHRPSYFSQAARLGFSLVLSGHTHGGQVALPFAPNHNASRVIADWTRGTFRERESTLYVNRGLGMAGLPLRINCPREIALIRLGAP